MAIEKILSKIEDEFSKKHLPEIQRCVQTPSISASGEGIDKTINLLLQKIDKLGGEDIHLAETMGDDFGHPQVYGEVWSDKNKPTILFYSMYDVQPVFPEKWVYNGKSIDPFGAEIIEFEWFPEFKGRCLMNRGITNQKGPTFAAFNVFETILEEEGELPVNIIFAIEGEEELGSPHMRPFIEQYSEKLKQATAVYFPMFFEGHDGNIKFFLGVRGVIGAKLWCRGNEWGGPVGRNLHSSYSGLVESPIFKLIDAIMSLKNDETNDILVPGIMTDPNIIGPSAEDLAIIKKLLEDLNFNELKESISVEKFRSREGKELSGEKAIIEQLFKPGMSVNGIEGGYWEKGSMTIIPHEVHANLDIRLPPFQKVDYVKECYQNHINKRFPMIDLQFESGGYGPAKMSSNHPLIQVTKSVYEKFNKTPTFYPLLAGSAPFSLFQEILDLPFVYGGLGHGGRVHSPLEYAVIDSLDPRVGGIKEFEKFVAVLFNEYGKKL